MQIRNFLLSILCSFAHLFSIDELKNPLHILIWNIERIILLTRVAWGMVR